MWERMKIQKELEKWNPSTIKRVGEDSSSSSSPKKKRGRPRGSKKNPGGRSLWIGFRLEAHDDRVDEVNQRVHDLDGSYKGKEIMMVSAPQ